MINLINIYILKYLNFNLGYWVIPDNSNLNSPYIYTQDCFIIDNFSFFIKILILFFSFMFFISIYSYLESIETINRNSSYLEFILFILFSIFFLNLLVSSFNLFYLFLCLEGFSFCIYISTTLIFSKHYISSS